MTPKTSRMLPPLVPGWPVLGNALDMAADPAQFFVHAAERYGPAYRIRYPTAPSGEMTVLAGLKANELATRHGHEVFTTSQYYEKLTQETGTKNYICALDGDLHSYYRKVVKPALSREATAPFVQDMIHTVEQRAGGVRDGYTVPVLEFIQRLTVDLLSLSASGCPLGDDQYRSLERYDVHRVRGGRQAVVSPENAWLQPGQEGSSRSVAAHGFRP